MPESTPTPLSPNPEVAAALEPVIEKGQALLRLDPDMSITDLAEAITADDQSVTVIATVPDFPPLPAPTTLDDDAVAALIALPGVFGKVNVTERRALTPEEHPQVLAEWEVLKKVEEVLDGRMDALKEFVRHSLDVTAEQEERADPDASPRDQHGHYVLGKKGAPERLPIPGTNKAWSREARAGKTTLDEQRLHELAEAGEISREDYLALTVEKRVFDPIKAHQSVRKNPRLLAVLARITRRGTPSSALQVRKATK